MVVSVNFSGDESLEVEKFWTIAIIDDDHLKVLVETKSRTLIRELAEKLGVSKSAVSDYLERIGKTKKLDKWMPHQLSENQKNRHFEVCSALILREQNNPFLDRIVTFDEKWILYDNRRRFAQLFDHDEAPKHSRKPNLH